MYTAAAIVFVYAVLVSLGGIFGYLKAKSLPSLIGGEVGFLALAAAGYGLWTGAAWGFPVAAAVTLGLLVFFVARFLRTRAFMPGGLMSVLSLLALVGLLLTRGR